jgi:hypothetical protein
MEHEPVTDLADYIQNTRMIDTHEHLGIHRDDLGVAPDLLQDLFDNYVTADLVVAGATEAAVKRLTDPSDADPRARFEGVRVAWERCRHTGYGEAVRLIARRVYGMDEITADALEAARTRHAELRRPGERLRILRQEGNLDHVQIDDFAWANPPDASGAEFFLYDLSWVSFCRGDVDAANIQAATGVGVEDLSSLRTAMATIFAKHGPTAIAVKSQHAYNRTLRWHERDERDVERALERRLSGAELTEDEQLCLGDWCWARGVELATEHNLPFKIHTGYYAGYGRMPVDRIRGGHLCALLAKYPQARFVLMHIAYPYSDELVALAKHYPNVYVDMCWAWSIDPFSARDFLRRMIHAVPCNKLFAFGGDAFWPHASIAYAAQTRMWLTRTLQAEVDEGLLTEREAIALATRLMRTNQEECFDIEGTRAAIRAAGAHAQA